METLFDIPPIEKPQPNPNGNTCRQCYHRQGWQCGGRVIQYCHARHSNRTDNGLLKIKVTNPACVLFKDKDEAAYENERIYEHI